MVAIAFKQGRLEAWRTLRLYGGAVDAVAAKRIERGATRKGSALTPARRNRQLTSEALSLCDDFLQRPTSNTNLKDILTHLLDE